MLVASNAFWIGTSTKYGLVGEETLKSELRGDAGRCMALGTCNAGMLHARHYGTLGVANGDNDSFRQ